MKQGVLAKQGRSYTAQPSCLLVLFLLWIQRKGEEWLQFRENKGFSNWWRVMLRQLSKVMRNPKKGLWLTSGVCFRKGQDERHPEGKHWEGEAACSEGCCAVLALLWAGDGPAQLLEADLKPNRSALQCPAASLGQAWEHPNKVPPPVGLMHFSWRFKTLKSHHGKWVMPREMRSRLWERQGLCQGQLRNLSHLCIHAWQQFQLIPVPSWAEPSTGPAVCSCSSLDSKNDLLVCSHSLRDKFVGCGGLWEANRISTCIKVTPKTPNKKISSHAPFLKARESPGMKCLGKNRWKERTGRSLSLLHWVCVPVWVHNLL